MGGAAHFAIAPPQTAETQENINKFKYLSKNTEARGDAFAAALSHRQKRRARIVTTRDKTLLFKAQKVEIPAPLD